MNRTKNLKTVGLIVLVSLCVYTCQKEKLNKKSTDAFLVAGANDTIEYIIDVLSIDNNGYVSKLWSYNLHNDDLDTFATGVQTHSNQIVLFADSNSTRVAQGGFTERTFIGIFEKYTGKIIEKFKPLKNYRTVSFPGQPIYNPNDGNLYFRGYGINAKNNRTTNGLFKINLSNSEVTVLDTNYYFCTLDAKNNILYGASGSDKIIKINLNTNAKEEFSISGNSVGTINDIAFLHFDAGLNKLVIGIEYLKSNNLYEVNLDTKKYNLLNSKMKFDPYWGRINLSNNQYSKLTYDNSVYMYNFKDDTKDSLSLSGFNFNMSQTLAVHYFQVCK